MRPTKVSPGRRRRRAVPAALVTAALLAVVGCGSDDRAPATPAAGGGSGATTASTPVDPTVNPTPRPRSGTVQVAALGDSITAGTPLYDPDPAVRERIGAQLDEKSSWEYWYHAAHPRYEIRNCGINGQRTDEIARRLADCARGAQVLVVQGGINDIAQGRDVRSAADNLRAMYAAGRRAGLKVVAVELLPWNNGYPQAAPLVTELNGLIHRYAAAEGVPVMPWFKALEDPANPDRMRPDLTIEGDHPSVAGYRKLASVTELP